MALGKIWKHKYYKNTLRSSQVISWIKTWVRKQCSGDLLRFTFRSHNHLGCPEFGFVTRFWHDGLPKKIMMHSSSVIASDHTTRTDVQIQGRAIQTCVMSQGQKDSSDRTEDEDENKDTKDTIVRKTETQINGGALMGEQRNKASHKVLPWQKCWWKIMVV